MDYNPTAAVCMAGVCYHPDGSETPDVTVNPNAVGMATVTGVGLANELVFIAGGASRAGLPAAGALAVTGAYIDARGQIAIGKPADQAYVNAGGHAAFTTIVGGLLVAAPETAGGSAVMAGGLVLLDTLFGGAIGNGIEYVYVYHRDVDYSRGVMVHPEDPTIVFPVP